MSDDEAASAAVQLTDQERFLPIANINRIMKNAIPENSKIAKAAKECVQECVSEFISFITSEASEKCQQEKRKTIHGEDILWAMQSLGMDNYGEPLKLFLERYRKTIKSDKDGAAKETDPTIATDAGSSLGIDGVPSLHAPFAQ